jgi:uncharacterized protein (DUF1330 family)
MSAYFVFIREKTLDESELEHFWETVAATMQGRDIKVLAAYGRHEVFEGPATEGVVIAQFPSMDAAKAWYNSPAYSEARQHRLKGSVYRAILVEGVPPVGSPD